MLHKTPYSEVYTLYVPVDGNITEKPELRGWTTSQWLPRMGEEEAACNGWQEGTLGGNGAVLYQDRVGSYTTEFIKM